MVSVDRITHGAPVANLIAKVLTVAPIEDPAPTDAEPDGDAAGKPPPKRERRSSTAPASAPVRARPRLMQAELVDPTGRITLVCPQSLATIVKPGRMVQVFGRTNCYAGRLQVQVGDRWGSVKRATGVETFGALDLSASNALSERAREYGTLLVSGRDDGVMTYLLVADRDGESAGRSNVGRDRAGNDNDREDRTIWTVPTSFPSLRDTERDAAARALISATDLPEYAFSLSHHLPPIMIPTAPPQPYRYIHLGRCDAASLDVGTYARWFGAEELRDVKHPAWVRGLIERAADVIGDTPGLGKESEGEGGREHDGMVGYGEDD